jgi:hypothetical protein
MSGAGRERAMKTWLAFGLLLVGCAGQPHPSSPSDVVMCRFGLISDVVHTIPDGEAKPPESG